VSGKSGDGSALRCAGIQRFVDTYLDGEFAESERGEFEAHLAECEVCRAKVHDHAEWKHAFVTAAPREKAPAALRNRVLRKLRKQEIPSSSWRRFATRVLPVAAAGGMVATLLVARAHWTSPVAVDALALHKRNLPIEIAGPPDQVRSWYHDKLDVSVRPPNFGQLAALRGGRLTNIRDRQAAYLVYDVHGNKLSVFIFDPGDLPIDAPRKAVVGNRDVYLDEEQGYNVALFRDRGLGYAIASDLDGNEMLKLVSSAVGH
jgi:anti-sigma factor RsiW